MTDASLQPTVLLMDLPEHAVGVRGDEVHFCAPRPRTGGSRASPPPRRATGQSPSPFLTAPATWPATPIWAAGEPDWALLRTEIYLPDMPIREAVIEPVGLSPEGGPGGASGPRGGRQHVAKLWANGAATGFGSVRSADDHPALHTYRIADRLTSGANALAVLAWAQQGRQVAARLRLRCRAEVGTRLAVHLGEQRDAGAP